jgi:hypothetical protein
MLDGVAGDTATVMLKLSDSEVAIRLKLKKEI